MKVKAKDRKNNLTSGIFYQTEALRFYQCMVNGRGVTILLVPHFNLA